MPSLTESTSPYDVLSPVSPEATAETTENVVDDGAAADETTVDEGAETTDEGTNEGDESGDGSDEGGDGDLDPAAKAEADANAKAEDAQWKAKEGNLPAAMKELIANNPAMAKRLKEMYFTNQRLMKFGPAAEIKKIKDAVDTIGGVDKLISLKNQIDMMGGEAGFQEAQQELSAWRGIDEQWVKGDPALVDHLASVNQSSFESLAPVFFGKLADVNPELYDNIGAQIIYQTFANDGTIMNLNLMRQALSVGDAKLAGQYADAIQSRIGGIQKLAAATPKRKAEDPRAKEWQEKETKYETERTERFQGDVLSRNEQWMNPKINTELSSYLNGAEKKLSQPTLSRLDRAVKEEIWNKHLKTNQTFMKQREALYAKRDLEGVERLYKQYAEPLFPNVTRQIAKEFGISPAAKRAAGTPQTGGTKTNATQQKADAGFAMVDKYPNPNDVDNKKTTFDMKLKDQFILKDGKKVQVRPLKRT